ncbi:MAG: aspartate/glutamate racemase family protein [Burkholderiales bacterium]|nr:aspartate/glutamate racemase family protein [Burkholderiales bacterium]
MTDRARIRANAVPPDAVLPGAFLGVVMLDTRFPRPPGDVGHPATFAWPVRYKVVPGAAPAEVVTTAGRLRSSVLPAAFVQAMRELEAEGAAAITTSCGFLVLLQADLQAAVAVPVVASSLLLLPALLEREQRVGVLTVSSERLTGEYLLAAGVPPGRLDDIVVEGVDPAGEFALAILGNRATLDLQRAQADVVGAARALARRAGDLRSVVLECTNMPPYAPAVGEATGWRLFDLRDAIGARLHP